MLGKARGLQARGVWEARVARQAASLANGEQWIRTGGPAALWEEAFPSITLSSLHASPPAPHPCWTLDFPQARLGQLDGCPLA